MKEFSEAEGFCRDTFAGDLSANLREEIVARMTRARRVTRIANGAKGAAIVALMLAGIVALKRPGRHSVSVARSQANQAVAARSLAVSRIQSAPFPEVVRTLPMAEPMVVRSTPTTVAIVRSDGPRAYEEISDEQMFRLLQGWSIALVKVNGVSELELLTR